MEYPSSKLTCCFTGHRYIDNQYAKTVKEQLSATIKALSREGLTTFITGGALGFDTLAAKAVLELKNKGANIRLIVIIPCRDQSAKWSTPAKKDYEHILSVADEVICLNEKYCTGCMHQRNRLMISFSSVCIAYFTGKTGGTAYTVNLARENGLRIINLAP